MNGKPETSRTQGKKIPADVRRGLRWVITTAQATYDSQKSDEEPQLQGRPADDVEAALEWLRSL